MINVEPSRTHTHIHKNSHTQKERARGSKKYRSIKKNSPNTVNLNVYIHECFIYASTPVYPLIVPITEFKLPTN